MHSIRAKLVLAFALVVLLGVSVVALLANRSTTNEFERYVRYGQSLRSTDLAKQLADYYAQRGAWQGVETLLLAAPARMGMGMGAMGQGAALRYVLADSSGRVAAATGVVQVGVKLSESDLALGLPIQVNSRRVGTLLTLLDSAEARSLGAHEQSFLASVNRALLLGGLLAALLATALGLWLAARLTSPLRRLDEAARRIAQGDLGSRVRIDSQDEVGALGQSFNRMAQSLEQEERSRQQMVADIAHELRTPLSIIQGNLEALQDGVFSPDAENLEILAGEAKLLARLVQDLQVLASAEAGQLSLDRQEQDIQPLLETTVRRFQPDAAARGVQLRLEPLPALPPLTIDAQRISQVLGNLLSNALRHTPSGGTVAVRAQWVAAPEDRPQPGTLFPTTPALPFLAVYVQDSGEGIPAEDVAHLFERFYRADRSRSRATGGSGLGLTIARQLARAHGGDIGVESQLGQGSTFAFTLPG
jgi:two-component system OmpR family sensor kinase/two-component system sensor histidine kinase BaeS